MEVTSRRMRSECGLYCSFYRCDQRKSVAGRQKEKEDRILSPSSVGNVWPGLRCEPDSLRSF